MLVSGVEKAVLVPVSVDDAISHELIMRRGEWGEHSTLLNTLQTLSDKNNTTNTHQDRQALSLECTQTILNSKLKRIIPYLKEI